MIEQGGWRTACTAMGLADSGRLAPINLCCAGAPEDIGLQPGWRRRAHGVIGQAGLERPRPRLGCGPTGRSAARFAPRGSGGSQLGFFCGLYVWYAVQVHQTKFLLDIGFSPNVAVWRSAS